MGNFSAKKQLLTNILFLNIVDVLNLFSQVRDPKCEQDQKNCTIWPWSRGCSCSCQQTRDGSSVYDLPPHPARPSTLKELFVRAKRSFACFQNTPMRTFTRSFTPQEELCVPFRDLNGDPLMRGSLEAAGFQALVDLDELGKSLSNLTSQILMKKKEKLLPYPQLRNGKERRLMTSNLRN